MKKVLSIVAAVMMVGVMLVGCAPVLAADDTKVIVEHASGEKFAIAFCFQDLETEFWVAGHTAIIEALTNANIDVIQYNANQDANKQLEQVNDAISQGVEGIIIIPQDGESALTIIRAANNASVPIAVFNRPPANEDGSAVVVVADNFNISYEAGKYMVAQAKERFGRTQEKVTVFHLIGDLGDQNAIYRKEGFEKALSEAQDVIAKVVEVPTEWDSNTTLNNLRSALQSEPGIGMLFCGSDFLYPQIQATLEPVGKWKKIGEEGHVIMGAVDGDSTAGRLMDEGFVDATAVQDVYYEATLALNALVKAINEKNTAPDEWLNDPGFALTQGNMAERRMDMWGNKVRRAKGEIQ